MTPNEPRCLLPSGPTAGALSKSAPAFSSEERATYLARIASLTRGEVEGWITQISGPFSSREPFDGELAALHLRAVQTGAKI